MRSRVRGAMLAACIAGCAALNISCKEGPGTAVGKGNRPEPGPARVVQVARVELRPMQRTVPVTGSLAAQERSTLSAKVAGRLASVEVDIGSIVRKGDALARIEPRDFELGVQQAAAALAQARAALGLEPDGENDQVKPEDASLVKQAAAVLLEATQNRERIRNLSSAGVASQSELDSAEATYKVAVMRHAAATEEARTKVAAVAQRRAELELAKKRLADSALVAPFDGVVQSRPAGIGEYVAAGTPIVQLVKSGNLRLRLQVPERDAALIRVGQKVRLLSQGDTNSCVGSITRLSPALDEQSRMLLVEADVAWEGSLRPGLFARAQIVVAEDEPGLSVPSAAVVTFAGLEKIVLLEKQQALERVVATGRRGEGWVELVSGAKTGELVILNPAGIKTGQAVRAGEGPSAGNPAGQPAGGGS